MEIDFAVAWWGERQSFATLVGVGSVIVGPGLLARKPGAPDLQAAGKLPWWRRALVFVPSSLYFWFVTWRQPPILHGDEMLADLFGGYALYDPAVYLTICVVSIVAGTDLTGGRALRLALYSLGSVVTLYFGLLPIVVGLHVIAEVLTAT